MDPRFSGDVAALSSASAQLGDLVDRVVAAATRFHDADVDDAATDLYEVERNLRTAARRLDELVRRLQP